MTSIHGNYDGSFLFYPWMTPKKDYTSQKTSKLLYYFLSLCKTFNELFLLLHSQSALPHKALLPESECKGRHFYRNSQAFLNKNRKKINRINLHLIIFNIFRRLNRVLFPAYPYMKSSRLTSHVFKASRIHGIPPQPQYLSETYPTENSH